MSGTDSNAAPRLLVIANPSSGGGSTARRLPEIERALRRHGLSYELAPTTHPGHASELAEGAAERGVDVVAVVGGDGTLNEAVQAWVRDDDGARTAPDLAMIPSGSGGDFRKTLGLSGSIEEAVSRIRFGIRKHIDLGVLEMHDHHGAPIRRAFVNIASFGVGGLVDQIVSRSPKWIGGRAVFALGTLRALAMYRNEEVAIRIDGVPFYEGPIFNVAIANGRYFGGGMKMAPHADPGDGRFEVVALGDLSKMETLTIGPRIYAGTHLGDERVTVGSGSVVEAHALHVRAAVLLDVDGEAPGKLPVRATIRPQAITFRC